MTRSDRLALAAAVATALAATGLHGLYADVLWVPRVLGAVAVVAVAGALLRRLRLGAAGVASAQVLVLLGYAAVAFVPQQLAGGVLPGPAALSGVVALARTARQQVVDLAAPVPTSTSLVLLGALGVGAVAVAVDVLVVGARRAAVAGLPLLLLLAVPSAVLAAGTGWWPFALGAAGWLGLLLVEGSDRVASWGPPLLSGAESGEESSTSRVGRRIGAAALGVSLVVPALLPGLQGRLLPGTGGDGTGGTRTVTTYNPIVRLQGQLNQPRPVALLRYRSTDASPDYLRLTTLDVFDGSTWRSSPLSGPRVQDGLAGPVGVSASARTVAVADTITASGQLDDQWLPVPITPSGVQVQGRWLYDAGAETVFSTRTSTRVIGQYQVQASRVEPDPALLAAAGEPAPSVAPLGQPLRVDPRVQALVERITASATSRYDAAVALQRFFLDPAQNFVYDTHTAPGGPDPLLAFLQQRRGFCEQYASAMAVMLRQAHIPARVAVGFTPGQREPDGSYVVSTADAHAWPEAWFQGAGWVRFEPTPAGGRAIVPPYALGRSATAAGATAGRTPGSGIPTPAASTAAGPGKNLDLLERRRAAAAPPTAPARPSSPVPLVPLLAALAALLVLAAPATGGALRRRWLWRRPTGSTGWEQVVQDAADVGHAVRPSEGPRAAAQRLLAERALPAGAAQAVHRLVRADERQRYARPGAVADAAALRADARLVRTALLSAVRRRTRLRAQLAPPSVLRASAAALGSTTADLLDQLDGLGAALGTAMRRARRRPA